MSRAGVNEVLAVLCGRKPGNPLTVAEICVAIDATAPNHYRAPLWRAVHKSLEHLRRRGFVGVAQAFAGRNGARPADYSATDDARAFQGKGAPIKPGVPKGVRVSNGPLIMPDPFRDRLWNALRVKKRGTLPELLQAASRDDDKNPVDRARNFLNTLARTDIVIAQGQKNHRARAHGDAKGSRLITYILCRDLGPKTPAPQRGFVFDQNDGAHIPYETKETQR